MKNKTFGVFRAESVDVPEIRIDPVPLHLDLCGNGARRSYFLALGKWLVLLGTIYWVVTNWNTASTLLLGLYVFVTIVIPLFMLFCVIVHSCRRYVRKLDYIGERILRNCV